jgi:nucleotidyltransferase substrate binding protein (TIGR01987 family)
MKATADLEKLFKRHNEIVSGIDDDFDFAFKKTRYLFDRLKEGVYEAKSELEECGVFRRFNFTYEAIWKTLKILLRAKGVEAQTPRDVFMEAFKINWIKNEAVFLKMMNDRNKTSHVYDRDTSRKILENIKTKYVPEFEGIIKIADELTK